MKSRVAQFFSVDERFIVRVRQFIVPDLSHDVEVLAPFLIADAVRRWQGRAVVATTCHGATLHYIFTQFNDSEIRA